MSFAQVIRRASKNADGTYTSISVQRDGGGYYGDDGVWVKNPPTTFTAAASVQPLDGEELERLPEGQREREPLSVFCAQPLKSGENAEGPNGVTPDRVTYRGRVYEVVSVASYFERQAFFEAVMIRAGS